jgi:hypothetical protein
MLEERAVIVLLALLLSLPLAIGAYATVGHRSANQTSASLGASNSAGKHKSEAGTLSAPYLPGGTSCYLPDGGSALSADWTHGDYVSAWSHWAAEQTQQGVSAQSTGKYVKAAANSDCGEASSSGTGRGGTGQPSEKSAEPRTRGDSHKP